jgi:hypothetical protein
MDKLYDLKKFNGRNNEVSGSLSKEKVWTALYSEGLESKSTMLRLWLKTLKIWKNANKRIESPSHL